MKPFDALMGVATLLLACNIDDSTRRKDFSENAWIAKDTFFCSAEIKNPEQPYDMCIEMVFTEDYPFSNFFLLQTLIPESDSLIMTQAEFPLMKEDGTWLAPGSWNHSHAFKWKLWNNVSFPYPGKYRFSFLQYMRMDTLPGIRSISWTLSPAKEK